MPEYKGTLLLKRSQIVIHWTNGKTETIPLVEEKTRIGRGRAGNEVAIPDIFQSVSRQHLEIRREKDGYRLIDLGSRNGTLVNGIHVKDIYLKNGDEIRIGQNDQGQQIHIEFQKGSESLINELVSNEQAVTLPPSSGLASESPLDKPYFKIRWQNGRMNYFPIEKDRVVIGRGPEADLRIPENLRFVSSQHAEVLKKETGYFIRDLNSTNGTLVNNQLLQPDQYQAIGNESIIRIGDDNYGISVALTFYNPGESADSVAGFMQAAQATQLAQTKMLLIGRLENCDIVLDSSEVSRRHAVIRQVGEAYFIEDLNSSNGTYVNDERIQQQMELHEGDLIQISTFRLLFQGGLLVPYQSSGMRLDVSNLTKDVKTRNGKRRILDNVDLSILPREFVAVVGGSGAGKSALLDALIGVRRGDGEVKLNGHDFYQEYERFRAQLGYVPQSDILHTSLTVEKALEYSARLRLPSSLTLDERKRRINAVLDTVSINTETIRKTRISDLSGEQRKRVSIAAELLVDPKLIYLDEATSGLDPGLEKKMMHTLRRMADEGRTVILITHATDNVVQTDHVAFLSEGRLVYFGPSEEALKFFEVDEFADIYERIDHRAEEWRQIFEEKKPEQYKKYILSRQANLHAASKRLLPRVNFGIADFFHQLFALTQRSLSVLFSDPVTLFLMFLLFPAMALLQLIIAKPDILTGNLAILADPVNAAKTMLKSYTPFPHTNAFIFLMGLEAVLAGLFIPSNDLVKERSIYLRERMVNLKALPYLLHKIIIYGAFVAIQVILFLLILSLGMDIPEKGLYLNGHVELFVTLYLTIMTGISFGLIISAVSRSTEMATYIITIILFFQLFFAGAVIDLRGNKLEPLSYLSTTRWSLTALGVTIGMDKIAESTILCNEVPENPPDPNNALKTACFHYPNAKDDLRLNYDDSQLLKSWAVLIGMSLLFLTVTWFLVRRVDST